MQDTRKRNAPQGEEGPLPRREQRKNAYKEAIEKASREAFLERGYAGVGVNEIARLAGVTKRTLYSYYPSKLALFIHVFDEYLQELTERILAAAGDDGATVRERLIGVLRALFDFTRENERFMWLYWMLDSGEAEGAIPRELLDHVKAWTKAMFDATIELISRGMEEGAVAELDPRLLAHLMSAVNKGIIVHANKERRFEIEDIDARELQEMAVWLLERGIFAAVSSTGEKRGSGKVKGRGAPGRGARTGSGRAAGKVPAADAARPKGGQATPRHKTGGAEAGGTGQRAGKKRAGNPPGDAKAGQRRG